MAKEGKGARSVPHYWITAELPLSSDSACCPDQSSDVE